MKMRESLVLQKLRSGEIVSCFKINILDPRVSELAALSGFDALWVDQEHIGQDWSMVAANVWATKAQGKDLLVRVARGGYSDYIRPLELDATGIMVPHVMSLEDAKKIVEMTRFHPIGRRPVDGGNADAAYTGVDLRDYLDQANRQRFVILQIEDPEPLRELDAIAALEGVDMLFFGPGDFSQGIGAPGDWNHPDLLAARRLVAATARKYGKFAGTVGSPASLPELVEMGYRFISVGADVVGLKNYCEDIVAAFGKTAGGGNRGSYLENQ